MLETIRETLIAETVEARSRIVALESENAILRSELKALKDETKNNSKNVEPAKTILQLESLAEPANLSHNPFPAQSATLPSRPDFAGATTTMAEENITPEGTSPMTVNIFHTYAPSFDPSGQKLRASELGPPTAYGGTAQNCPPLSVSVGGSQSEVMQMDYWYRKVETLMRENMQFIEANRQYSSQIQQVPSLFFDYGSVGDEGK